VVADVVTAVLIAFAITTVLVVIVLLARRLRYFPLRRALFLPAPRCRAGSPPRWACCS